MKKRPQDAKNLFYARLNVDKRVRECIKFYQKWKKVILNEVQK